MVLVDNNQHFNYIMIVILYFIWLSQEKTADNDLTAKYLLPNKTISSSESYK